MMIYDIIYNVIYDTFSLFLITVYTALRTKVSFFMSLISRKIMDKFRLTRDQRLYEDKCSSKIDELYGMDGTSMLGVFCVSGLFAVGVGTIVSLGGRIFRKKTVYDSRRLDVTVGGMVTYSRSDIVFRKNVKEAIQNGSFERDIPMCRRRGELSIQLDPNLSDSEKKIKEDIFSRLYMYKLENDEKPISSAVQEMLISISQMVNDEEIVEGNNNYETAQEKNSNRTTKAVGVDTNDGEEEEVEDEEY